MRTLLLHKPSSDRVRQFLADQAQLPFSYADVGATATAPPAGFTVHRTRVALGSGEGVFQAARRALERWEQFRLGWVDAWSPETPLAAGQVVAIMAWAVGVWWLNACRIVYVVHDAGPTTRFGFAYGTLPGHVASGEERFLIEWDRESDQVWYDVLAFSRPRHMLTRLGYPVVRCKQRRFGRDSAAAMRRAVQASLAPPATAGE